VDSRITADTFAHELLPRTALTRGVMVEFADTIMQGTVYGKVVYILQYSGWRRSNIEKKI
jgi:hypothetical protein